MLLTKSLATTLLAISTLTLTGCVHESPAKATVPAEGTVASKASHAVHLHEGRLYVMDQGSEAAMEFERSGPWAEQATAVGAGPNGTTLKAPNKETLAAFEAYLAQSPEFLTITKDRRLWILRNGSEDIARFFGPGIGDSASMISGGRTLKAVDMATIEAWRRTQ